MNQDQPTKLQQVVDLLKTKGMTDDQIAEFTENITKTNFAKLYTEAMTVFTEEDLTALDQVQDQNQANQMIANLYQQRTGKNVQQELQKMLEAFCDGVLEESKNNPS